MIDERRLDHHVTRELDDIAVRSATMARMFGTGQCTEANFVAFKESVAGRHAELKAIVQRTTRLLPRRLAAYRRVRTG